MATFNQAMDTFISITGASVAVALRKLERHGGDLNAAVNAHFSEGDRSGYRNVVHQTSVATHQDDLFDIDDPVEVPMGRNPLLVEASVTNQKAIDTFISITGASKAIALRKLEQHGGDLNAAVNTHFGEGVRSGDRNVVHEISVSRHRDDLMDIDDPIEVPMRRNPLSPQLEPSMTNPFSLIDPHVWRHLFDGVSYFMDGAPFVSQPREVREIPMVVKDSDYEPSHSAHAPIIEDATETEQEEGPGIHGTVIVLDEDYDDISDNWASQRNQQGTSVPADSSCEATMGTNAPDFDDLPEYSYDIEEEIIRTAIEASKREAQQHGGDLNTAVIEHFSEGDRSGDRNVSFEARMQASQALDLTPSASTSPDGDEIVEVGPVHYPSIDSSPVDLSCPPVESVSAKTDGMKEDGGSSSCVICEDAPVEGACVPCGHMAGCMSCLNEIKAKNWDCPVCRKKIDQVIRVYAV